MKKIFALFLLLIPAFCFAQNRYFLGIDMGPKVDIYKIATGGERPYKPSLNLRNDVGAFFGVNGGVVVEDKIVLEVGLYKSNFRTVIDIVNSDGQEYFINTPINTITTFMMPINFYVRKNVMQREDYYFQYGLGVSTLIGSKIGIPEVYYSHSELLDPEDPSKGTIDYTILEDDFDANLVMVNANIAFHFPVNHDVAASLTFSSRFGVAGNNYVDIEHSTPKFSKVSNTIYTQGSGWQLQFGFRYYLQQPQQ